MHQWWRALGLAASTTATRAQRQLVRAGTKLTVYVPPKTFLLAMYPISGEVAIGIQSVSLQGDAHHVLAPALDRLFVFGREDKIIVLGSQPTSGSSSSS
jgi:hypothetical protein